ncbi:hypothetical protein [Rhodoglobus aureus]|uniref:Uncharacterized protein n=1 Tax=Rhodoglobus aureus TaxID=191497 RepID=A0ABP4GE23_9MICO
MTTTESDTPPPTEPATPTNEPASPQASSLVKPVAFGLVGAGIGLTLGLVLGLAVIPTIGNLAGGVISAAQPSPITTAVETCGVETNQWIDVGDAGQSLSMQSLGEESSGAEFEDVFCVLDELNTPDSALSLIRNTRALDGRQSADWNGFSASWGYHPDDGLDIVIDVARG